MIAGSIRGLTVTSMSDSSSMKDNEQLVNSFKASLAPARFTNHPNLHLVPLAYARFPNHANLAHAQV
jgi:hypothetical protein